MNNEICVTKDYSLFSFKRENRPVNDNHVSNLMRELKRKFLLMDYPILVNSDYEIIDGQHRFTAAKNLGLPIYYKISNNIETKDLLNINICVKKWNTEDLITHLAKNGNAHCEELLKLSKQYEVPLHLLTYIFKNRKCHNRISKFDEFANLYALDDLKLYVEDFALKYQAFVKVMKLKYIGACKFITNCAFVRAFIIYFCDIDDNKLISDDLYKRFMKNLEKNIHKLRSCGNISSYHEIFDYIINYGKHKNAARSIQD